MKSIQEVKQQYYKKIDLLDLELIISRVIKKTREFVLTHPEFKIIKNYELRITNYIKRRINGEPIAYIFGEKEFYGLNFKVNKNTLVPRPETELIVDEALNIVTHNSQPVTLIDVGAGSGCIIITLAKILNSKFQIPNSKFIAIDISKPALRIARQNAKLHQVDKKIKFIQGDLLKSTVKIIKNNQFDIRHSTFVILANLPYLTPAQIKNSPSIQHEPSLALNAGRDGLKYYRLLFKQIKKIAILHVAGCVLCEIDPSQAAKIKKIIKNNLPAAKIKIKKDLSGFNRLIIITIKNK